MNKTPKLRFKEFSGEWENKHLNKIVERVTRKNKGTISKLPLTISAQYGLVDQEIFFNKTVASKNLEGYYLLENGEFAYNKSYSNGYPWGAIKRLDRYEKGVLSSLYICFKTLDKINSDYIKQYFETSKWYKEVSMIAVEGARNHGLLNISVSDFFDTLHYIPSSEEQEKIASFLSLIDDKISFQYEKIEMLKSYKKGTMKKIFRMELRFKDDEGRDYPKWKTLELNQLLYEHKKRNVDLKFNKEDVLSVSGEHGIVNQIEHLGRSYAGESVHNYHIVNKGDIVYTKSPLKSNPYGIIKVNKGKEGIVSTLYAVYSCKDICYGEYLDYYFQLDDNTNKYLRPLVHKGAKNDMKINNTHFLSGKIVIGCIEEQIKISKFLSKLDIKIRYEQDKLDSLNEYKKGLLQQMFV